MYHRPIRIVACASLLVALAAFASPAKANLLVDPSFELNPLTNYANVLTNFPTYQGQWGAEVGAIVGAENGVTPAHAVKMLRMDSDGLVATQTFQVTDITSYAAQVDSGSAIAGLSAHFNVEQSVPGAIGGVQLQFFSASNYGSQIGVPLVGVINTLDSNPTTWESAVAAGSIPVGTRWLLSQVYYSNASLIGSDGAIHPGYVDAADLRVTPEPGTLGLLALAVPALFMRRR